MHCPRCLVEYQPHVARCRDCGVDLVTEPPTTPAAPGPEPLAVLGRFHATMAAHITTLLADRAIGHEARRGDDGVRVLIDPQWRDELRAELALTWGELVRGLPADEVVAVLASGGSTPGWYDAPRGGHIDRAGRLVVEPGDDEEAAADAARTAGPALMTAGAILVVSGWLVFDATAVLLAGVALLALGLFSPR